MDIANYIQNVIPKTDSPDKIYELFRSLGYNKDKLLDPTYKRKIDDFEFAKDEREKVKEIYTVFNYDGKLQIFLIEVRSLSVPFVKYLTKRLSDRYLKFLIILTTDYKEYTFVFPEFERIEEERHKLKLTKLNFDREQPYYTDLLTISNLALIGDEENWRDIWERWKDAFSVEKVTDRFFEDYKNAFFVLRDIFEKQKILIKDAHELSQQFLNRLMFLYFISKKRWLNNDTKFIRWYWERYKEEKKKGNAKENTFYENWLRILFLEAFNNKYSHPHYHPQDIEKILTLAPYLNGGLFHRNELDELPFSISDSLFEKVFTFFEKYNFIIREELPLDIEVAVDPQMIGYVYESLSNVAEEIYERQDLGIFYTPNIEVDFMCRRSLVEYISNHLNPPIPPLAKGGEGGFEKKWIYRLLFDEDKKAVAEHITKKNYLYLLEEVFDNLAVVDPACGSGAFLVGMLHVLAELYRLIYSHINREMTEFELKKKIIGNSLYGVDVMPWAVHSAELRLWLQLIIEEDIPYAQRKLYPLLPNLNLKLRVGDSLVQEIGGVSLHLRDSKLSSPLKGKLTSLKREKEKYYNNDDTRKFKSDEALHQEELRIFGEILNDKIVTIQKEIQVVEGEKRKLQMEMFEDLKKDKSKQKSLFEEQIKANEQEIEYLRETKRKIQIPGQKPCIWDIDFAEIFGDKGGFDIVIGNPPYVRQEKIAPPNKLKAEVTLEDKREYKDKLLNSIQVHYPFVKKLDKKSDYYIYFYFHGLSLLNDKGTFCFITSNSWLDVGYGKDLQEFLLKYSHVKAIYDNEAKRSFEHADVNTIIALFGPPQFKNPPSSPFSKGGINDVPPFNKGGQGGIWPALSETAKFVMFKDAFDKVINTKNLLAIENADAIHKAESYRVYPAKQETLLEEGWEKPEEEAEESELVSSVMPEGLNRTSSLSLDSSFRGNDKTHSVIARSKIPRLSLRGTKSRSNLRAGSEQAPQSQPLLKEKFITGKYEGNKWGGKYLRAPDIFFTILEKGKGKLVRLGDIAEVKAGIITGDNAKYYQKRTKEFDIDKYSLVFKSPKEVNKILLTESDAVSIIKVKNVPFEIRKAPLLWVDLRGEKHICHFNKSSLPFEHNFYGIYAKAISDDLLCLLLNSSLVWFFIEILGRKGLGGGAVRLVKVDLLKVPCLKDFKLSANKFYDLMNREIYPIFTELGINPAHPVREQKPNPLPDRKALDDIVFDILGLTEDERNEVYWAVCELVKNRLEKARSV